MSSERNVTAQPHQLARTLLSLVTAFWLCRPAASIDQPPADLRPTCRSPIYCQGELLDTVQMARVFEDSKTFVDMRLKNDVNETLHRFAELMSQSKNEPTRQQIATFVDDNFEDGNELETWQPSDWNSSPLLLERIKDDQLREWARDLVALWIKLGRKIRPEVAENPDLYSLIPIPEGFIVPGGRFKEIYYWDTFWIIKGLLLSDMPQTVRGMLDNLIWMIKRYGHVPNGSRVYYTERSQPPLLSAMAALYVEVTKDLDWLRANIVHLDNELDFWIRERTVEVPDSSKGVRRLAHYFAESRGPRSESYREDVVTANGSQNIYTELKSAAESGWDFSNRWVVDSNGSNSGNLSMLNTRRIIPVDLNAYLCGAFDSISQLHSLLGENTHALRWKARAQQWRDAVHALLWNEEKGTWFDVDSKTGRQREIFYASNIAPLWTNCLPAEADAAKLGDRFADYLESNGALNYPGGIPTSMEFTGEQWDLPNAWPPLQSITINALKKSGGKKAQSVSFQIAQKWVFTNFAGYKSSKEMYEKYDAESVGKYGYGGEYKVQPGFGWTNGVILELLDLFSSTLSSLVPSNEETYKLEKVPIKGPNVAIYNK